MNPRKIFDPRKRVSISFPKQGRTKRSFLQECDINSIVRKFNHNGQLSTQIKQNPIYANFADLPSYQQALDTVIKAQEQFDALPSELREKFNNEPSEFLSFVSNPANTHELIKLGLSQEREPTLAEKRAEASRQKNQKNGKPDPSDQALPAAGEGPKT